jgi:imidazolonepropionase-like amidohydrolase
MLKQVCLTTLLIIQLTNFTPARSTSNEQSAVNSAVFAFVDVNVVAMDSERVIRGQTVIVSGGRVVLMGATGSVRVPKGATRIEGRNRYLIPGLADMHVHLEYFDRDAQLLLFLANGVTTVRSMDGRPNILAWRKRIADGTLPGPTIFTAGAILEGKPPLRDDNRVVETPAQAGPAVEEQKRAGYDFVKL